MRVAPMMQAPWREGGRGSPEHARRAGKPAPHDSTFQEFRHGGQTFGNPPPARQKGRSTMSQNQPLMPPSPRKTICLCTSKPFDYVEPISVYQLHSTHTAMYSHMPLHDPEARGPCTENPHVTSQKSNYSSGITAAPNLSSHRFARIPNATITGLPPISAHESRNMEFRFPVPHKSFPIVASGLPHPSHPVPPNRLLRALRTSDSARRL
jgi:hypothetical protein